MRPVKIIHCGDLHIGSAFSSIPEKSKIRQQELMRAFNTIIEMCQKEKVEILLIAGDLFEGIDVPADISSFVIKSFEKINSTKVFIALGNHDPYTIDSDYRTKQWPQNVYIFRDKMEFVELEDLQVRVWGAAFVNNSETHCMLGQALCDDDFVNICVIHGDLVSNGKTSIYNPITTEEIEKSQMDYVALGHVHKYSGILKAGKTSYAYSGCIEGRGFDELGKKGIIIGTVEKNRCKLEFKSICERMYLEVNVDVSGSTSQQEIADCILKTISTEFGIEYSRHLYKINLTGELPVNLKPSAQAISVWLTHGLFFYKILDKTTVTVNLEELSHEISLKGTYVRKILEKINDCKSKSDFDLAEKYRIALNIGLRSFEGEVKYDENN